MGGRLLTGLEAIRYQPGLDWPDAPDAEVVVVYEEHAEHTLKQLANQPKLRLVQALVSGVERWAGHLPPGCALTSARGASGAAVAEWALTMLLALTRDLPGFAAAQTTQTWDYRPTSSLVGARVLVLGMGDVGGHLARCLAPFTPNVTVAGRTARPGALDLAQAREVLPDQDAVVLTLPLAPETRGLVDAAFLNRMKPGAVLVNAGRGGLIDQEALADRLKAGCLRAALDVTDPEPLPPGHLLWACPGLIITPHIAAATHGELERLWKVAAEQIQVFLSGGVPVNLVQPS
jgi:phosphoglycerate dehydrogenase-like enzyme